MLAVDLGIADVPLGVLIVAGVALLVAAAWWRLFHDEDFEDLLDEDDGGRRLAIPHYAESQGLRDLAASFKIELPLKHEVTKDRKFSVRIRELGGERGSSETRQYAGEIDLPRLAQRLDEKLDYDACGRGLADAPAVADRQVLADAVAQLSSTVGETSQTRELLRQVEETYDRERAETVVKRKREELAEVAEREKLILMRGKFNQTPATDGQPAAIVLTHFDPPPYYGAYGPEMGGAEPQPQPVPDGVGIRVALPDDSAFTPAGRERISRGEPFYGQIIAHSPSYNSETGVLSCAAYAVWGTNRPRPREMYGC